MKIGRIIIKIIKWKWIFYAISMTVKRRSGASVCCLHFVDFVQREPRNRLIGRERGRGGTFRKKFPRGKWFDRSSENGPSRNFSTRWFVIDTCQPRFFHFSSPSKNQIDIRIGRCFSMSIRFHNNYKSVGYFSN